MLVVRVLRGGVGEVALLCIKGGEGKGVIHCVSEGGSGGRRVERVLGGNGFVKRLVRCVWLALNENLVLDSLMT